MNRAKIEYSGAQLSVPEFLVDLWPHDLPLIDFPSFCGAGDGIGDMIVPEGVRGAILSPACFIHDIDWALAPSRNVYYFVMSNVHFLFNNRALVEAQLRKDTAQRTIALHLCNLYAFVVTSPIGWKNFQPEGITVWNENPTVQQKLHRLATATMNQKVEAYV